MSARRKLGYAGGQFGFNLLLQTAALLLMFYYTDVLGLAPATAGYIFAGAIIWDALFDPLMGYLADRTRTRWGRYRPYLIIGAIPLAASWALVFLPSSLHGASLIAVAAITHTLFRTVFAVVNLPYLAMAPALTSDSAERGVIAGYGIVAGASATVLSAFLTLWLVATFGGGQLGFFRTALLYGGIAALTFVGVFLTSEEPAIEADRPAPSIGDMIRMLRVNNAFWLVAGAYLCSQFGITFFQKTLPYYFKYRLLREDLIPHALGTLALTIMLSIPLWTQVMRRRSKRFMWLCGISIGVAGSSLLWLIPPAPLPTIATLVLLGFGAGANYLGFWSTLPDTIEFGEWRSGVRAEGLVYAFVSLIGKAGLGVAAAALGEALTAIGYAPNTVQSPATLYGLKLTMIAIPAGLYLLGALAVSFYRVDAVLHARLVCILSRRLKSQVQKREPNSMFDEAKSGSGATSTFAR